VCRPDYGHVALDCRSADDALDNRNPSRIKTRCRLIEQEQPRLDGQSAGDGDELRLTAGQGIGPASGERRKLHFFQQFIDALAVALAPQA
jgi:hypothetical protein